MERTDNPRIRITPRRRALAFGVAAAVAVALALVAALGIPNGSARAITTGTIWGTSTPQNLVTHSDNRSVEVGTKFTVNTPGSAVAVRFYKTSGNTGTHVGTLWTSTGTKLASVTFSNESAKGWQTATFAKPVVLQPKTTYVVSYHAPHGQYADTYDYSGASQATSLGVQKGAGVFQYSTSVVFPTQTYRQSQYWVDIAFRASTQTPAPVTTPTPTQSATPTATPKPTQSVTPTPTPTPTQSVTTPAPTPTSSPTASSGTFPNASNTGVPAGTTLTDYTGPCTISTANTVITARTINCSLTITAKNVTISKSVINGTVYSDNAGSGSFTISDSQVNIGDHTGTGIGDANFTAIRVHVTGGNRSINCFLNCTVESSYVHGQFKDNTGVTHESGIRLGSGSVIKGNTIACTAPDVAPDAGCSAALTGYGDFAVVQNDVVDGNLFIAGSGGYCAYGGSTTGKPYSAGVNNIRFTNNVFQRGTSSKCGWFGPITSFDVNAPGNVWSNNTYDNGQVVAPAM